MLINHLFKIRSSDGLGGPAQGQSGENGEIVGGPRTPQQMMAQKRMQQTQAQVDSVGFLYLT